MTNYWRIEFEDGTQKTVIAQNLTAALEQVKDRIDNGEDISCFRVDDPDQE